MADIKETTLRNLVAKAKDACKNAYCPYSGFSVGAAILTETDDIFTGCNVENASYGLTICAERNAVFQMVASTKQKIEQIKAVVIYTPTSKPAAPCGACRQVINEFGPNALIICVCDGSDVLRKNLAQLLPDAFGPADIE